MKNRQKETGGEWPSGLRKLGIGVCTVLWLILIVLCIVYRDRLTPEAISAFTPRELWLAALVLILCFLLKSLSIAVYAGILYAVSGLVFPLPLAVLLNLCGTGIMVSAPYLLGKLLFSAVPDKLAARHPRVTAFLHVPQGNEFILALLSRSSAVFPSDIVSLYCGATGFSFPPYLAGSLLGMLPQTVTFPVMGVHIREPGSPEFLISLAIQLLYSAAAFVVYRIWKRKAKNEPGDSA